MFKYIPFGNGGAFGRNVGTLPDVGVEAKVGVGETGSVATIWERGTAVGFFETSDTEGAGGSEGSEAEPDDEGDGDDEDWAFAKRKEKRTEMSTSLKIDAVILENAGFAVAGVADGEERRGAGEERETNTQKGRADL